MPKHSINTQLKHVYSYLLYYFKEFLPKKYKKFKQQRLHWHIWYCIWTLSRGNQNLYTLMWYGFWLMVDGYWLLHWSRNTIIIVDSGSNFRCKYLFTYLPHLWACHKTLYTLHVSRVWSVCYFQSCVREAPTEHPGSHEQSLASWKHSETWLVLEGS